MDNQSENHCTHALEIDLCVEHTQVACNSYSFVKLPVSGTVANKVRT